MSAWSFDRTGVSDSGAPASGFSDASRSAFQFDVPAFLRPVEQVPERGPDRVRLPDDIRFLADHGLGPDVLADAALRARAGGQTTLRASDAGTGGGPCAADLLLAEGLFSGEAYYRALAATLGVPFLPFEALRPDPRLAPELVRADPARLAVIALEPGRAGQGGDRGGGVALVMAPRPASVGEVIARVRGDPRLAARLSITTPENLARAAAIHSAVHGLAIARPECSAAHIRLFASVGATLRAAALIGAALAAAFFAPGPLMALAGLLFVAGSAARFCAGLYDGVEHPLRRGRTPERHEWPLYTVLVPLYREADVAADLVAAMARLDYPRPLLDIKFLVEEDDAETRAALARVVPGPPFEILVVPAQGPRTKPKALSYAMRFARGDLVTVFDAEDRPEPDQLMKVARLFASAPLSVGCVQARLAVDHAHETFFTRQFALEYATLFDILLPWMAGRGLLLPLGGTSNHFRRRALEDCGGWDPHNVTEDIDIGIRLVRDGWRIVTVNSTTWEEAPLTFAAWLNQRVRWHKGWLQTWLVHMKSPRQLWRDLGPLNFTVTVLLFAGTALALVAHPAFLGFIALYAFDETLVPRLEGLADITVMGAGTLCLVAGYGASAFAMLRAARLRRLRVRPRDWAGLPFYWLMMSVAFAVAVVELVLRPSHWRKTRHGLARGRTAQQSAPEGRERGGHVGERGMERVKGIEPSS